MAEQSEETIEQVEGIDLMIEDETRRILLEWIGLNGRSEEGQAAIEREALRLQQLTETASVGLEKQAQKEWAQRNPGKTPTYWDVVRAKETAWRAAREMILEQELYPQVTPELIEAIEAAEAELDNAVRESEDQARISRDPDRWKSMNVRHRPVATRIVERVWLEKPAWFHRLATALVAQRIEDNQVVPMTAYDPVADDLEEMIDEEMRANPPEDPNMPF